eukprot:3957155-Pyramimonas_sp.AAC.1
MYITTHSRKDTCSDTSAHAEASYSSYTSLGYYTPDVHPPTPLGNFFDNTMRGNMRYDIVPPPPPRRLTTTHHKPQPTTFDYDLRGHWIVGHMRGGDDTRTASPHWDPAGQVPFREFVREVHAWINVATGTMMPSQQAAALQRGLGGLARTIAMRVPSAVIIFGVNIGGRHIPMASPTSCSS